MIFISKKRLISFLSKYKNYLLEKYKQEQDIEFYYNQIPANHPIRTIDLIITFIINEFYCEDNFTEKAKKIKI